MLIKKIKECLSGNNLTWVISFLKPIYLSFLSFKENSKYQIKNFYKKVKRSIYLLKRSAQVNDYFQQNKIYKLQLGGGSNILLGWLNTDLWANHKQNVILDVTRRFPFDNDSFDYIFCEHMIEHIRYVEVLNMLKECYRVLKPGGKMRVSTPDLDVYLSLLTSAEKNRDQQAFIDWVSKNWLKRGGIESKDAVYILNLFMHGWGHEFLYNFKILGETLKFVGFKGLTRYSFAGESNDANLQGLEKHAQALGKMKAIEGNFEAEVNSWMNNYNTIFVEVSK